MISLICGRIFEKNKDSIVVETSGGVGYLVHMTALRVGEYRVGQEVKIYTYLKVSDSALDLYGFENSDEKSFFELLMTVSGVGPKSAMNILSLGHMSDIQSAIARGDVKYLTGVQGMGKKTAERLVVELKSKLISSDTHSTKSEESDILTDVIDGLVSLGYSREEAKNLVQNLDTEGKTPEQILKQALKK